MNATSNPLFRLAINHPERAEPRLQLGVSLTSEAIEQMRAGGAKHAFLLLITAEWDEDEKRYYDERRHLHQLKQGVFFLSFDKPGSKHVFGAVIYSTQEDPAVAYNTAHSVLMSMSCGDYRTTLLMRGEHELTLPNFMLLNDDKREMTSAIGHVEHAVVTVPKEFFAAEWPEWVHWWTDLLYDNPSRDQCQFRRRALVAFTVKPLGVAIVLVIMSAIACVIGAFWTAFLQRVKGPTDLFVAKHHPNFSLGSYLLTDAEGARRSWITTPLYVAFVPIHYLFLTIFGTLWATNMFGPPNAITGEDLACGFWISVIVLAGSCALWQMILWCLELRNAGINRKKEQGLFPQPDYLRQLGHLTHGAPRIRSLPLSWRTVTLYYKAAEARICRPYAQ